MLSLFFKHADVNVNKILIGNKCDLVADKQMVKEEQPLQVARCTKIINAGQVRDGMGGAGTGENERGDE